MPLRVGFVGLCPDGTFQWGFTRPAPTQFRTNLKSVSVSGTFANVRDLSGVLHTVTVERRAGRGPERSWSRTTGLARCSKERSATATARIVFDGETLVDGAANFLFPEPFIRVDIEK